MRPTATTSVSTAGVPSSATAPATSATPEGPRSRRLGSQRRGRRSLRRSLAAVVGTALLVPLSAVPAHAAPPEAPAASVEEPTESLPPPSTTTGATIRADAAWERGYRGAGVGVALIDTGVAPVGRLGSDSPQQVSLARPGRADGDGHGTFLAGLIAGQDGPDGPTGIAPEASVWSVKVADDDGLTSLEQILAGLDLVRLRADELGIRVVVLALGGPADDVADPIETALEQLWADGLVVVVASGNGGELTTPGTSPYLLTVGAIDDGGTADWSDDVPVDWSGVGVGRDGRPKPDLLVPGASVVSWRAPGSVADRENPGSRIDGRWFRGTGTSMAAASAAGATALLLEAQPELTPDEVKGRLIASTRALDGTESGVLDVGAALDVDAPAANTHLPKLDAGSGPLGAEAGSWVGRSWVGRSWVGRSWVDQEWVGRSWIGRSWVGRSWVGRSWVGRSWVDHEWVGRSWVGRSWVGRSWVGRSWVGRSWVDHEWVGRSWVGRSWVGRSWVDHEWVGRSWVGRSWVDHEWVGRSWVGRSWVDHEWVGRSWVGRSWV